MKSDQKLPMNSLRLEALGDGIFAVAMTIMVIELRFPEMEDMSWLSFKNALLSISPDFLCYFISFVVTGIMWFGHRMIFEFIGRTNRYFIFLGILFYMVVCLVPFSTKLLAQHTFKLFAIAIYGLNLSLCNLVLYTQWCYGINRKSLLEREVTIEIKKTAKFLFLISPVVYSIAIIIAIRVPLISIIIFTLTPLLYLLPNKIDEHLP